MIKQSGFGNVASMRRAHPRYDLFALATKAAASDDALRALTMEHFPI